MSYHEEFEQNYSNEVLNQELENMSREGLDLDSNLTERPNSNDTETIINETPSKSERALKIAIGRFQGSVRKTLTVTGDYGQTRNIVKEALKNVANGRRRIENMQTESIKSGTEKIVSASLQKSVPVVMPLSRQDSLTEPFGNLEQEELTSLSLIDKSAMLLHGAMEKLLDEKTDNTERIYPLDSHRVNAAVKAAQQIANLMRVKIDAVRLTRGPK